MSALSVSDKSTTETWSEQLFEKLKENKPFSFLTKEEFNNWLASTKFIEYKTGQRLFRPDELNDSSMIVIKGSVRHMGIGTHRKDR